MSKEEIPSDVLKSDLPRQIAYRSDPYPIFQSWDEILNQIQEIRFLRSSYIEAGSGHDENSQKYVLCSDGAIRDFIIRYLDLHIFSGIDGNLLDAFNEIEGSSFEQLRSNAYYVAFEQLSKQVRKGNTFFLDVSKMKDRPELGELIADILEVRMKQLLRLESNPPLVDVFSTFYGFKVLSTGSAIQDTSGITKTALEQFSHLTSEMGKVLELNHTRLRYSNQAFGRVSDYTRRLLWNLLLVSAGGINATRRALTYLGELRDSRALDILHQRFQSARNRHLRNAIYESLIAIRHRDSIPIIEVYGPKSSLMPIQWKTLLREMHNQ